MVTWIKSSTNYFSCGHLIVQVHFSEELFQDISRVKKAKYNLVDWRYYFHDGKQ